MNSFDAPYPHVMLVMKLTRNFMNQSVSNYDLISIS